MRSFSVKAVTYSAICIALSVVLSNVKIFHMPQGGSVTACSMFFIAVCGYWFGPVVGITAGVARGLLELAINPYVVHPAQLLLDYPLAFGIIGVSGFFAKSRYGLQIGYTVGALGRFFMSFLSGFIFFAQYAPEGQNVIVYSFVYNISYILPEIIATLIIISIPVVTHVIGRVNPRWQ